MARDSKKKAKDGHAGGASRARRLDGQVPKLDARLAKFVAKRVKKLRVQLADATRREQKKVRALDKAHRRRQLIEAAIDELSIEVAPPARPAQPAAPVPAPQPAQQAAPSRGRSRKAAPPKA